MFCVHCRRQIDAGVAFCEHCGKSQQQYQTPAPPAPSAAPPTAQGYGYQSSGYQSSGYQSSDYQSGSYPANAYQANGYQANTYQASGYQVSGYQRYGYQGLLAANGLGQGVKHFAGLFTQIAVSESGYIAIYYPYEPEIVGSFWKGPGRPEQQERLEILHISQINDFDIEYGGMEQTKVSGGAGGAIVGGLLGGALGSVIGSSLTSGKVKSTTTITDVTMVINTKDFNNPRIEADLYKRYGTGDKSYYACCPLMLREYLDKNRVYLSKEGKMVAEDVYGVKGGLYERIEPNIAQIEVLESTLTQMLAAQQQRDLAAAAAPQASSADELIKYKALLDSGVITPEEFNAKKRQLLGL